MMKRRRWDGDVDNVNVRFYRILDEITRECETLMAKGVVGTGAGFDAPGQKLDASMFTECDGDAIRYS